MDRSKAGDAEAFRRWDARPWGQPWSTSPNVVASGESIDAIGLGRGMCYGMCPVYEVELSRLGTARFVGEYFVSLMGPHEARLDPAAFADLALAVTYLGFDAFEPQYAAHATDMATTTIWIERNGSRSTVADYGNAGPASLGFISHLIDELSSTFDWHPATAPAPGESDDGTPIFAGSTLRPEDLPRWADDVDAHWTQRPR